MVILQSFFQVRKGLRSDLKLAIKLADLSCKFLKKHGYTTVFCVDKKLINIFKHIKYDEFIFFDENIIDYYKIKNFWSVTKLLACLNIQESFLHIDTDLFLIENCLQSSLKEKFLTLNQEFYAAGFFRKHLKDNYFLKTLKLENANMYNCSIFGGQEFEKINHCIKFILNDINDKKSLFEDLLENLEKKQPGDSAMFYEQLYLIKHIADVLNLKSNKLNLERIPTVVNTSLCRGPEQVFKILKQNKILHLCCKKEFIDDFIGLEHFLDLLEKYYF